MCNNHMCNNILVIFLTTGGWDCYDDVKEAGKKKLWIDKASQMTHGSTHIFKRIPMIHPLWWFFCSVQRMTGELRGLFVFLKTVISKGIVGAPHEVGTPDRRKLVLTPQVEHSQGARWQKSVGVWKKYLDLLGEHWFTADQQKRWNNDTKT